MCQKMNLNHYFVKQLTLNHFARTRTHDLPALGLLSYFVWNHNIGRLSADYHATWVRKSTEKYFVKSFLWWLQFVGTSFSRTFLANLSSPETVISQKLSRRLHTVWNLGNFCITWNLFREINYKVNSLLKKLFSRKFFKKFWYKNFVIKLHNVLNIFILTERAHFRTFWRIFRESGENVLFLLHWSDDCICCNQIVYMIKWNMNGN